MKMRGISWIVLVLALSVGLHGNAQKFAYIDTDHVLLHLPEYSNAQTIEPNGRGLASGN